MPDGSLQLNLSELQDALSGVQGLLGAAGTGGATGSGYAGAAQRVDESPADQTQGLADTLEVQLSGILEFEASGSLSGIEDALSDLGQLASDPPVAAFAEFGERLQSSAAVFEGELVEQLEGAAAALAALSDRVPPDATGIAGVLLDQLLRILERLEGPEADDIRSWAQSVAEMAEVLAPLIEAADTASDPAELALQVFQHALDSTLEVFGASKIQRVITLLEDFPSRELDALAVDASSEALTAVMVALDDLHAAAQDEYPAFRDTAVAAARAMEDLREELRPILGGLRRVVRAPVFQPGALERYLREQMEAALQVEVHDVQKIDNPFNALFDRLDEAIDEIDLSAVRTEILGFFDELRAAIEAVDVESLASGLETQLVTVQSVVDDLEASVSELTGAIESFFDQRVDEFRQLTQTVGSFQPDGSFRYDFQDNLRAALMTARTAIQGDPSDPDAPSVAGTLEEFQSGIDQVLGDLNEILGSVEGDISDVASTAVGGIQDFTAFVEGLDLQVLVEQLRSEVEEILEALGPVDFAAVVDPIITELNENASKLSQIDPEALNELLREALATALDIIIQIDFTAEIATPLRDEFQTVKQAPAAALGELQRRYEEALTLLDHLSPEQLLEALSSAFAVVDAAIGGLDLNVVLQPLDDLHDRYLAQPLAELRPSTLLEPVGDAFDQLSGVFDQLDGAAAVAPVDAELKKFKTRVQQLDATAWVDELTAGVESIKANVRRARPSDFLDPLNDEFQRLESELERVKPSVLLAPVADLATPLLDMLADVQQETVTALFEMFQGPIQLLEKLEPQTLTGNLEAQIEALIQAIEALRLPSRFNQLKGRHYDIKLAVEAGGVEARIALVAILDPQRQLGEMVSVHDEILDALRGLKSNLQLQELLPLYGELQERLLGMLPPYAQELLDPEAFRRLMRRADPTRFLDELDTRFDAIVDRLVPIRPQDLADELDTTYETVLDLVEAVDVSGPLERIAESLNGVRDTVAGLRVDFVAADIDRLVGDLRGMAEALDVRSSLADLEALHQEVELVVQATKPSEVLAELHTTLSQVQALVSAVDPREVLAEPLGDAWEAVEGALGEVDFTVILQPLVDTLDDLEVAFEDALRETETAFDEMLGAGRGALRGGGATASVSI